MRKNEKIDRYLKTLAISENTRASYKSALVRFEEFCRTNNCYTFAAGLERYKRHIEGSSLSASTKKAYIAPVRGYVRWTSDSKSGAAFDPGRCGGIEAATKMMRPKIAKADVAFVCRLASRKGEAGLRDRAIFLLALTGGMTPEEIADIMPEDLIVDESDAWIHVRNSDVTVKLVPAAKEVLLDYLECRETAKGRFPLLAVTAEGKRRSMSSADVRKSIAGMLDLLGHRYERIFHGDAKLALLSVVDGMEDEALRRVADFATSFYYSDLNLMEGCIR